MSNAQEPQPSPYHAGELRMQELVGVAERMAPIGRKNIRNYMPDQHREFYAQLPFIVLGTVDNEGATWPTLLCAEPGFVSSPDPQSLAFEAELDPSDPAAAGVYEGAGLGMLGIQLETRRRNRVNGFVTRAAPGRFAFRVEYSYGNCPQYIQLREHAFGRDPAEPFTGPTFASETLDARARQIIGAADTFFVSSYVEDEVGRHVDVSHRGGKPGFVRINADGSLTIPDFAGNLFFNTLGNFLQNPQAGLAFPDFETGDMLQLSGTTEVILDSPEIAAFQGAERLWTFRSARVLRREGALPLRWRFRADGVSPNNLMTGDWGAAADRIAAAALKTAWRPFRIARIVDESAVIRSFYLEPADGAGVVAHEAGQHLPIRVSPAGATKPVLRTYTISNAPSDGGYRISVKRQGFASDHLHDHLAVGDIIESRPPAGDFTIDAAESRPAVLLAAGVGITPMLAMARHLVYEGLRKRRIRPTWLFLAARTKAERAFHDEIMALAERAAGALRVVRVLADDTGAAEGDDFERLGRIDIDLLRSTLPFDGYDFYMCGPPAFMQSLYDALQTIGTPDDRVHAEAFGPASLKRTREQAAEPLAPPSTRSVPVAFVQSAKEARWEPGSGSLLDLAEARGMEPAFGCRSGSCGTCAAKIVAGAVTYLERPQAKVAPDMALVCCAIPVHTNDPGKNRLVLDL